VHLLLDAGGEAVDSQERIRRRARREEHAGQIVRRVPSRTA
jgi:hypothetical protein